MSIRIVRVMSFARLRGERREEPVAMTLIHALQLDGGK